MGGGRDQPEHALRAILAPKGARFGSLEARLHFPRLVSRGGSYFGSDKVPSRTLFGSILAYIHVILERLSDLALLFHNVSLTSMRDFNDFSSTQFPSLCFRSLNYILYLCTSFSSLLSCLLKVRGQGALRAGLIHID